jgi:hypothetical protein
MYTWITKRGGRVDCICQTLEDGPPGPEEWEKVPNDWNGNPEDRLEWYDADMRRIPDAELVKQGKRKDCRGEWYGKETGERKLVYNMDEEPGGGWTREAPLEYEPYQKWDEDSGSWVVDTGAKEKAGKEKQVAGKKAAIEEAERRIQRSMRAKLDGTAGEGDEEYYRKISGEIEALREELRELTA